MYVIVNTLHREDNEQRNSGHKSSSRVTQSENPSICTLWYTILHQIRPKDPAVLDQGSLIYGDIKYVNEIKAIEFANKMVERMIHHPLVTSCSLTDCLIPGYCCEIIRNADASFEMTSSAWPSAQPRWAAAVLQPLTAWHKVKGLGWQT